MRSAARMEKEFSGRIEEENRGTLWQMSARESTSTGTGVVYGGSNSNIRVV